MKKLVRVILTLAIVISTLGASAISAKATATINIGDYMQMGKYYDESILWRCVDIDENGPLMLADRILTIKPFDIGGQHKYSDGNSQPDFIRGTNGSNLWETSNIRSWLNSTATAGNITWIDGCPPIKDGIPNGYNAYATEKGFVADGNFTLNEREAMKTVTQKSILNSLDQPKLKIGGDIEHIWDNNIVTVVQNYDVAYYHNVTDKVFLLDVKQLNKVYQNETILGTYYYIGKLTQKAVENSENKKGGLNVGNNWSSWIRTPCATSGSPFSVRCVIAGGGINQISANSGVVGVRPAFYINLSVITINSGNASENNPYVLDYSEIEKEINITIDDKNITFDVSPQIINGRTMVPLRKIFEELGADVAWDSLTKTVTGVRGSTTIVLTVDSDTAIVNGETKYLDMPATILDGRTLVPARFISESLGCKVDWNEESKTVIITSK